MDKIVCAVEEWDSILDYYRPNGSSKTWYLKEEGKIQLPHMWGYWSILNEDSTWRDNVRDLITLPLGDNVIYTRNPKKITDKYLYLLPIYDGCFFELNYDTGFKCISPNFLKDIQNGDVKLILIYHQEGPSGSVGNFDLETIQKWIDELNIPPNNVYFINGNLYSNELKEFKKLSYNIIPVSEFEGWINFKKINLINTIDYSPRFKNDLLLSYNRAPRSHRLYFLVELLKNNLMDSSLISCSNIPDTYHNLPDNKDDEFLKKLKEITPIEIDTSLDYNLAHNFNVRDHEETFISVVTETLVDKNTLFLSEKIWKPISIGHPFMVIGNKGTLEYLKSLGFKTYDKWVDESYDEMNEWEDRVDHIIQELVKFNKLSIFEKKQIRNEMFEICDFNKKYFINHCLNKYDYYDNFYMKSQNQLIYDILYDIWKLKTT